MKITILTLFPEILDAFFTSSIMGRAVKSGLIGYELVNIRDFATDKHRSCDHYPYGGGAGMVLLPGPLAGALESVHARSIRTVYMTPSGKPFSQRYAEELAKEENIAIICGRYEGIDQRIIDRYVDDEISVGDYVLSSGETAALVVIDSVYRLLDGVINSDSLTEESFGDGLLEYPHYTRPEEFDGLRVPDVLLSGHHAEIRKWRLKKSLLKTARNRPELLLSGSLSEEAQRMLEELKREGEIDGCDQSSGSGTDTGS